MVANGARPDEKGDERCEGEHVKCKGGDEQAFSVDQVQREGDLLVPATLIVPGTIVAGSTTATGSHSQRYRVSAKGEIQPATPVQVPALL